MELEYEKQGKIAIFTINRPEALNALGRQTYRELRAAMEDFYEDPDLLVGILTGAGDKAFSAGDDVKEMNQGNHGEPKGASDYDWKYDIRRLEMWKPFIAAINGYCLGGGLEVALSCDLRIASENARLGLPEITRGLIANMGGNLMLPRIINRCHAAEILLTGKHFSAEDAYRIGLVNKVVPQDKLMPAAMELAEEICQAAPLAVKAAKEVIIRSYDMPMEEGRELVHSLASFLRSSEDYKEGTLAFLERRKPNYQGK